jgi:hypothetical protein
MARNSRTLTRIFFATVLAAGLMGGWFASARWDVDVNQLLAPTAAEQTDWVDALSLVGEEVLQFFLGWTNAGNP